MVETKTLSKLDAIEYLLRNGHRHSEWAEAGLLWAIDEVFFNRPNGVTKADLDALIGTARDN